MDVGTRVKVCIPDDRARTWARNYLAAVQGLTGVVIEKGKDEAGDKLRKQYGEPLPRFAPKSLVLFDDPPIDPSPMAPRERKLTQFWIQDASLQVEQ